MIQSERITQLNYNPVQNGRFVLYWMQGAQREEYNHALEYSIEKANKLDLPVLAAFGLTDDYPEANLRHYTFMLEGLNETQKALKNRGIKLAIVHQSPDSAVIQLAGQACAVIVDSGYTRIQRQWRKKVAENINCSLEEVETELIVPVREASDKENYSAGVLRPRINKQLDKYLIKLKRTKPRHSSLKIKVSQFDISKISNALDKLKINRNVKPSPIFKGGAKQAERRLKEFIENKLDSYAELRNDPSADSTSNMSPYLHFGQISPLYIALKVTNSNGKSKGEFLEELIIRRELSSNFVFYNRDYDKYKCLPAWASATLNVHRKDKREYVYSIQEFEYARTHDPCWNAAQKEMLITGKMHGYMRMYWGKKILEWSKSPEEGFRIALLLNNKYELDGRGPNGFAGVAWCFGKHDRAWRQRDIFGKVRYMNQAGLKRKFDADKYIEKVNQLYP